MIRKAIWGVIIASRSGRRLREILLRIRIIMASALVSQLRLFCELTLHQKTGQSNK